MTIETPEPYGWTIEGTPIIWRGGHAIADAKSYARRWKEEPEPIPLYREPPVTEKSSAAQPMQDEDLTAVYLAGMQRGKELALKSKVELNKVYWEGEKLIGVVKAPVGFVGLTHDEVVELIKELWGCARIAPQKAHSFAYAVEAKLKEKNQ